MRLLSVLAVVLAYAGGSVSASAADKKAPDKAEPEKPAAKKAAGKLDPSGSWTWTSQRPGGEPSESKLVLKLDGDKLTGTMARREGESAPISDGKVDKDGTVTFKVERERNGEKMVATFKGKLAGDSITGAQTSNFGGQDRERPWEAKRAK